MLDTSQLPRTSEKRTLRWRDPSLTLIWLRPDGPITVAYKIEDKRQILTEARDSDDLLALRQVRYPTRQEVMVIDDREPPLQALLAAD